MSRDERQKQNMSLAEPLSTQRDTKKDLYLTRIKADNGWIKACELLTRTVILQRFRSDTSSPSGIKFIIYPF